MRIDLMYNSDEITRVDKSPTLVTSYPDCQFKDAVSVTDPVITMTGDIDWSQVNYFYIPVLGRYYYITEPVSRNNGLWEIRGHVDVLNSFKTQIRQQTALVKRQQFDYNLELPDNQLPTLQSSAIQYLKFPGVFDDYQIVIPILGN